MTQQKPEAAPPGQHIFHATHLTELAIRWKELTAQDRHDEAMPILEQIIEGSTSMFMRLAQYEGFHYTVDLDTLVQSAREKVVRWLMAWDPKRKADGGLFTWMSSCAKNAFRSELSKVNQHRQRFHATSDNLEKFFGSEDHTIHQHDAAADAKNRLKEIAVRWGDPQELGSVKFCIDCMVDERTVDKQAVIRSACYAYGISPEMGKFFYNWGLFALRNAMYDKIHIPFTKQDILRHRESYSQLVDLLDIVGWEPFKKLAATMGGQRLKIPTLNQLSKWHEEYLMACEIDKEGQDPATITKVGRKYGKTHRGAQEIYEEMLSETDHTRAGEHSIYESEG